MDSQTSSTGNPSFDLNSEQRQILETADQYARKNLAPLASRMDDEEWWPDEEFRALGKMGYLGTTVPSEYGGTEMDLFSSGARPSSLIRYVLV